MFVLDPKTGSKTKMIQDQVSWFPQAKPAFMLPPSRGNQFWLIITIQIETAILWYMVCPCIPHMFAHIPLQLMLLMKQPWISMMMTELIEGTPFPSENLSNLSRYSQDCP